MMNFQFTLGGRLQDSFHGSRTSALMLRHELEAALDAHGSVVVDFTGFRATQSFMDELIGLLVYEHGPAVLGRLTFRGCADDIKALLELVVQLRARDFAARIVN